MKLIYAMMKDGSQILYKRVDDDFDVEEWAEKRKWNFQLLGIKSIQVYEFDFRFLDESDTNLTNCE